MGVIWFGLGEKEGTGEGDGEVVRLWVGRTELRD